MASLHDRLDRAIDKLLYEQPLAGQPPDDDPALRPLLDVANALTVLRAPAPVQPLVRERLTAALMAERSRRPGFLALLWESMQRLFAPGLRPALATFAVIALILLIGLSGKALPGQPHYPVKRGVEAVELLFSRTPAARARFYTQLADQRLAEMEMLAALDQPTPAETVAQLRDAWLAALAISGADQTALIEAAALQTARLQALLPGLSGDARLAAEEALAAMNRLLVDDALPQPPTPPAVPEPSRTPTPGRTLTPTESPAPTVSPSPSATPRPTSTSTPTQTAPPTVTPLPSETQVPLETPAPNLTATAEPAETPRPEPTEPPTATPTPRPTESTETPEPTERPTATPTPAVTRAPTNTPTPRPTATQPPEETPTVEPTETDEPTETPEPEETKAPEEPDETPEPE